MTTTRHRTQRRVLILAVASLVVATSLISAESNSKQQQASSSGKKFADQKTGSHLRNGPSSSLHQHHHSGASAAATVTLAHQQEQLSRLSSKQDVNQQVSADKKQGDHAEEAVAAAVAAAAAAATSSFGPNEYLHIRPEEVNSDSLGKDMDMSLAMASEPQPQVQLPAQLNAEHKSSSLSADDELNAQLANSDSLIQLESSQRPHSSSARGAHYASGPMMQRGRPALLYGAAGLPPMVRAPPPRKPPSGSHGYGYGHGQPAQPARQPPSYITLKGKLTGINSLISQYPHPAPGYPHQGPRHLPRGAAAGYAAFRDFVRAHASKYKHAPPSLEGPKEGQYHGGARDPATSVYSIGAPQSYIAPSSAALQQTSNNYQGSVKAAGSNGATAAGYSKQHGGAKLTKVSVAQAYIPHMAAPASPAAGGDYQAAVAGHAQQSSPAAGPYGTNPMLAKLYGAHAPQGVGRPEYNKDYGMVIHYPQATVYTEPMTVDQLHKLTGAGISQVLAQLQHNLAHGHQDESNTIRPNNHHDLGHGLSIHAKEYYAPDKGGRYVPTTAAIISAGNKEPAAAATQLYGGSASGQHGAPAVESYGMSQIQMGPTLGAGYERVKQAVAASQERYNANGGKRNVAQAGDYGQQQQRPQQQQQQQQQYQQYQQSQAPISHEAATSSSSAGSNSNAKYNGEPLSSVTNFIGAELEALYRANAALTKQLEPELQAQLASYAKSLSKTPLRYTELDQHRPSLALESLVKGPRGYASATQQGSDKHGGPRIRLPRRQTGRSVRYSNRYHAQQQQQQQYRQQAQGHRQSAYRPPQAHPRPHQPMEGNYQQQQQQHHHHQQQQLQSYQAAEQNLNQQMYEMLRDFHAGDDQYNGKNQQLRTINQGYPYKVMQKQQSNAYGKSQQQQAISQYNQHEGLEIPQGANDQIGEIADLIEALKGTLEAHRPDTQAEGAYGQKQAANTLEDVRYLASALGQTPSYAAQVPVASNEDDSKKGAYQQQQQPQQQQPQQQQYASYQQSAEPQQQQQHSTGNVYEANKAQEQTSSGYQQQQQQQQQQTDNYAQHPRQQTQSAGYGPQAATYGQQTTATYGQQQQQQQAPVQAADYTLTVQHDAAPMQPSQAQYGPAVAPIASQVIAGQYTQPAEQQHQQSGAGYQQQQSSGANYQQQQQSSAGYQQPSSVAGYSSTGHTQVINHLVPASQQQQQAQTGDYASSAPEGSAQTQQPANQIAVAAPTDAQYQQAQSLSSFVDSLPTDYQELLRQPALEGGYAGAAHLAALGQEAGTAGYSSSSYNATSAAPSTSQATSSYESQPTYLQQAYGEAQNQQQQQHQQQQQQQQPAQYSASK